MAARIVPGSRGVVRYPKSVSAFRAGNSQPRAAIIAIKKADEKKEEKK